jgi:predicted RNase H-like nuclease
LVSQLPARCYRPDDLNDALAALWTAERIAAGIARRIPDENVLDRLQLEMAIWA